MKTTQETPLNLQRILNNRNAEGKIYLSDIDIWLEHKLPLNKVREVRDVLMENYETIPKV